MNYPSFKTTEYTVSRGKVPASFDGFRIAVIADLHDCTIGGDHSPLLQQLERQAPDLILLAGDMITETGRAPEHVQYRNAAHLLRQLPAIAPVWCGLGNHEKRWQEFAGEESLSFADWRSATEKWGIRWLENESAELVRGEDRLRVTGLSLPRRFYNKRKKVILTPAEIETLVGRADREAYQILLAHTPAFTESYMAWGAGLALAGHYHGGVVRLPFLGGVISTNFRLFPKYDCGCYPFPSGEMVVTAGLGCHTIPVRLWNPPELILLTLRSEGQERLPECRERVPLQQGRMSAGKEEVHGTHRV